MNFLFRYLFRNIPPQPETKHLVRMVCGSAYQVFLHEDFRTLVQFEKQSQTEQDRMFNEFVVTALILLLFTVDDTLVRLQNKRFHFWKEVRVLAPGEFTAWLSSIGVAGQYVDIWRKLIDLRLAEYTDERKLARKAWDEHFAHHPDKAVLTDAAALIETLTVGSLLHIMRGQAKTDPTDPLRRHLRTWLTMLHHRLVKRVGW